MKIFSWFLIPAVVFSAGCERMKEVVNRTAETSAAPSGAYVRDLAAADYDSFVSQEGRLAVVEFHATWCGPCKKLAPVLEKVAAEHQGRVVIGKVDVDQARDLALRSKVHSIPDVRLFRGGRQVQQFTGVPSEGEIREMLATHSEGLEIPAPAEEAVEAPAEPSGAKIQPMKKEWLPPGVERR